MKVERHKIARGTSLTFVFEGNVPTLIIDDRLAQLYELICEALPPRALLSEAELFDLYKQVAWAGGLDARDEPLWTPIMVELLHKFEASGHASPELIRACCHIVWGRPCYPGVGSLTLCAPTQHEGALSLAADGACGALSHIQDQDGK